MCRVTRSSPRSWAGCGSSGWGRWSIRTCRSGGWWMTWPRTGHWPATRCSRSWSPCRITPRCPPPGACPACGSPLFRPEPGRPGTTWAGAWVGLWRGGGGGMVAAIWGVWRGGAAYLPLDPGYPPSRLGFMLTDSRAAIVVTRGGLASGLAADMVADLDDPQVAAAIAGMPAVPPPGLAAGGRLAYVIYTSGSTGTPKGVAVAHAGVANLAVALRPALGVGPGTAVLQFASFRFDSSGLDVAVTLAAGGPLAGAAGPETGEPGPPTPPRQRWAR